jgi:predicted acetyltransferase
MSAQLPSPVISLATRADKSAVARLMQLYLHDFSEFAKIGELHGDVDRDGNFQYPYLDRYWVDSEREPLLIWFDGQIAGFALVNDWSASGLGAKYCMAEFFILRKYRAIGIGKRAAHELIRARSGVWEIPVAHYNLPALQFWRSTLNSITGCKIDEVAGDGERWAGMIFRIIPLPTPDNRSHIG